MLEVQVKGRSPRLSKRLTCQAVRFYASMLMSTRLMNALDITVVYKSLDPGIDAEISADNKNPPRSFDVLCRPNFSRRKTLIRLAHEMVHIKQYATGELKEYIRFPNLMKYRGEQYNMNDTWEGDDDYYDSGWEIEAFGREYGLYIRFLRTIT